MKRHRILLLLLVLLAALLCIAVISFYQLAVQPMSAPITITCGQSIYEQTAEISDVLRLQGANCRYDIVLENSSLITVRMKHVSGDMDPFLALVDETGTTLVEDDDSGGNGDALIENFLAERPGRYVIVASSYGNDGTGTFELLVDIQSEPQ